MIIFRPNSTISFHQGVLQHPQRHSSTLGQIYKGQCQNICIEKRTWEVMRKIQEIFLIRWASAHIDFCAFAVILSYVCLFWNSTSGGLASLLQPQLNLLSHVLRQHRCLILILWEPPHSLSSQIDFSYKIYATTCKPAHKSHSSAALCFVWIVSVNLSWNAIYLLPG